MRALSLLACVVLLIPGSDVFAHEPMIELAHESGCFVCHKIDGPADPKAKRLAPSYAEVARRYVDDADAEKDLVARVIHGSVGKPQRWKETTNMRFMPPSVNIDEATAVRLVRWILSLEGEVSKKLVRHDEMLAKARYSGCMACHAVEKLADRRYVPLAPAFEAVAGRYRGRADALGDLTEAVVEGTMKRTSRWRDVNMQFMPPSVNLNEAQAKELVAWILALDSD